MTHTIPPDSPKAARARAFGDEMVKACRARGVTLNELARSVGIGHTALDHYRTGAILPKTVTALAIAAALDWPKLARLIREAREFTCVRPGCGQTFRNDGGSPKKFCGPDCARIVSNQRQASRRLRRAGQGVDEGRQRAAAMARLRSAVRIADERTAGVMAAVAAFCAGCEPEGMCREPECALRGVSPLPLLTRAGSHRPRTDFELRSARWTPERRDAQAAASRARWTAWSPEQRAAVGRAISEGRRRAS